MSNYSTNTTLEGTCEIPMEHGVVLIILNLASTIFGSIGNSLVCATIYTTTGLQTISNYFLVSMAVADLMVTILAQPLLVGFIFSSLGGNSCIQMLEMLFRLVANVSCASSVLHLCFISVDRCLMVRKPHTFSRIMTRVRSRVMLVTSWVLPVIYGALRLTVSKEATSYFTVVVMAICYMVIIVCYTLIILQVRKQQKLMQSRVERYAADNNKRKRDQVERRVAMTIGIVIIVFTISWLPIIFMRSRSAGSNSGTAYNWARTLALCNSALNPWIYCYRIPEFRAAYKRLFILCSWGQVKGSGIPDNDTSMTSESGNGQIMKNQDVQSPVPNAVDDDPDSAPSPDQNSNQPDNVGGESTQSPGQNFV